jgi:cyclopropane fatty-acyl-phospholipid synthase-like methyltransferase
VTTPEEERARWDAQAADVTALRYSVWAEHESAYERRVEECLSVLEPRLQPALTSGKTTRVLDLGCGLGRLTIPLALAYPDVQFIGLDISAPTIEIARYLAHGQSNVEFIIGDGRSLAGVPRLGGAFSMLCFQHVPHEATIGYLADLAERLERESTLVFQHVIGAEDAPYSHQTSSEQLKSWCQAAGFHVQYVDVGLIFDSWAWVTAVRR